ATSLVEPAADERLAPRAAQLGVELTGQHPPALEGGDKALAVLGVGGAPPDGRRVEPVAVGVVGVALFDELAAVRAHDVPAELRDERRAPEALHFVVDDAEPARSRALFAGAAEELHAEAHREQGAVGLDAIPERAGDAEGVDALHPARER